MARLQLDDDSTTIGSTDSRDHSDTLNPEVGSEPEGVECQWLAGSQSDLTPESIQLLIPK